MRDLGFDYELGNAIFMISRLPGLIAHAHEERTRQTPMRQIDPKDHPTTVPASDACLKRENRDTRVADELNPQAREMADESMVRNLAAQAEAIWPQEQPLFERYGLPQGATILDAGCGTGEITGRLAGMFPTASLLGVDIIDDHLALARSRSAPLGSRVASSIAASSSWGSRTPPSTSSYAATCFKLCRTPSA